MQTKSLSKYGEFRQDDLALIIGAVISDQAEPAAAALIKIGEEYAIGNKGMALMICERIGHLDKVLRILCPDLAAKQRLIVHARG